MYAPLTGKPFAPGKLPYTLSNARFSANITTTVLIDFNDAGIAASGDGGASVAELLP